uniref:SFRICE_039594 n=1 Tax=Spodoptera frugiperda TaxID=7108 RepID=A0A2H1WNE6_SPOFR
MKKKPRAEYDYSFDTKNEITMVRWKDNNVVTMGTKSGQSQTMVQQKVDVNIPKMFGNYNKGMGGVDQMDQSTSLYRISIKGKKW